MGIVGVIERDWPTDPYKGLTHYGPEDGPLLAGRSPDLQRVASRLSSGRTRILLLHGATGCGKSSFLQAALIPYLEDEIGRFSFGRDLYARLPGPKPEGGETRLFVRSTNDPVLQLATRIYAYAALAETAEEEFSDGTIELRGSAAISKLTIIDKTLYPTAAKFTAAVSDDPELLVNVIGKIAYARPRAQALVIDQAEEVLTWKPGPEGNDARRQFFMFLAYLSESDIDFRLIIAFRTEYHGRLYAALKTGGINAASVEDYFLDELKGPDLVAAIKRPTSQDVFPGYQPATPLEKYSFLYEKGLPELIASDLDQTRLTGGTLPVLQIVCRRLYQKVITTPKVNDYWVIRTDDYRALGGLQGQVDLHLQEALEKCCQASGHTFEKVETARWRDILADLAEPQPDGTVTTKVRSAKTLSDAADARGCRLDFGRAMEFLQKDEWKIVRSVELTQAVTGTKVPAFTLGHDVLGAVLERWKVIRDKDFRLTRIVLIGYGVMAALIGAVLSLVDLRTGSRMEPLAIVLLSLGIFFLFFGLVPNKEKSPRLYAILYDAVVVEIFRIRRRAGALRQQV